MLSVIILDCFFLMPCCVFLGLVMSWPHSGQVLGVFRFVRLYLHFLQCWAVEVRLPIRPLMRSARAMRMIVIMVGVHYFSFCLGFVLRSSVAVYFFVNLILAVGCESENLAVIVYCIVNSSLLFFVLSGMFLRGMSYVIVCGFALKKRNLLLGAGVWIGDFILLLLIFQLVGVAVNFMNGCSA